MPPTERSGVKSTDALKFKTPYCAIMRPNIIHIIHKNQIHRPVVHISVNIYMDLHSDICYFTCTLPNTRMTANDRYAFLSLPCLLFIKHYVSLIMPSRARPMIWPPVSECMYGQRSIYDPVATSLVFNIDRECRPTAINWLPSWYPDI